MMKRPRVAHSGAAPLPPESVPHFNGIRTLTSLTRIFVPLIPNTQDYSGLHDLGDMHIPELRHFAPHIWKILKQAIAFQSGVVLVGSKDEQMQGPLEIDWA